MKNIILVILLSLFANIMNAQDFAPVGAKWNYTYSNFYVFGYNEIISVSDTSIDGLLYNKLVKTRYTYNYLDGQFDTLFLGAEFVRNDADKVYIYRNGQFYTLYDFSAEIGDTWQIPMTYESPCDTIGTVIVTAKGDTIIDSQQLRYFVTEHIEGSSWSLFGTVIEKIGAVTQYLLPEQSCVADIFEGGALRCYNDDDIIFEQGPYPCTYLTLGTDDNLDIKALVTYPNPAKDYVIFELPQNTTEAKIQIYDIYGKVIKEITSNTNKAQWDFQDISSGVYFYTTEINGIIYRGKVVVRY